MIESLCLISAEFSGCILMIDSCFSHAMKYCALSKALLRYIIFLSDFLLLKILNKRDVFDKIVKLTNMLVEPKV
jgi:hypothetical protein